MENIERIHLLSSTEVEELYARHEFNAHEQSLYFSLSPAERAALEQFRNTRTEAISVTLEANSTYSS